MDTDSTIDILQINEDILIEFEKERNNIDSYKEKLVKVKESINDSHLSYRIKTKLQENEVELIDKIKDIETNKSIDFYIMETNFIIDSYKEIIKKPMKVSFMFSKKRKKEKDDIKEKEEKRKIITKFLEIASKYKEEIILENKETENKKIICDNCNNKKDFEITPDHYICQNCGNMLEILSSYSSYKDVERVNITARYTYDRKVHFRDCMNQYQGKQNASIKKEVNNKLIEQFELHGLLIGDENTCKEEKFKNIERLHIYLFLREIEFTKHYEDAILIHYQITGKKPDDISYLENKLLDDFDILTTLYDKKFKKSKKIDRKNFINTQYVLFQLLKRHKHPCKKEDFNILKTIDRKSFHDDICKELFETLGWNFTAIF